MEFLLKVYLQITNRKICVISRIDFKFSEHRRLISKIFRKNEIFVSDQRLHCLNIGILPTQLVIFFSPAAWKNIFFSEKFRKKNVFSRSSK